MPQYHVTITSDLIVNAPDEATALQYHKTLKYPNALLMHSQKVECKEQRPEDNRLLTQVPNVPQEKLQSLITAMTDVERIIIAMCVQPTWSHEVYTAVRFKYPSIDTYVIARAISGLKLEGWLNVVRNHIEHDLFPHLDVPALSAIHNDTLRRYVK